VRRHSATAGANGDREGDKVAASFKNDVLTITVPESAQAQSKTRRIPIDGGSVEH
jgi:HSP20 family protein